METTQKNREAAGQPRRSSGQRPASRTAPPDSAQQRNGAVRTAEGQRNTAKRPETARPAEPERPRKPRPAAAPEKKAPARKKAPAKKTAAKPAASQKQRPQTNLDEMSERRRAYGNSKPKKKSGLMLVAESVQKTAKKVGRKKSGKGSRSQQPTPAVIYTDPQPFNRSRFAVQMISVVAVVAAFVLALSVFFKVEKITVTGAEVYSAWAMGESPCE